MRGASAAEGRLVLLWQKVV